MTNKEKIIKELKEVLDSLDITNEYRLNLIKAIEYLQEEPVSEELNKAAEAYIADENNYSHSRIETFKAGAQWYKQQMMKDAVDGVVHHYSDDEIVAIHYNDPKGVPMSYYVSSKGLNTGDNVKLITVKEDL